MIFFTLSRDIPKYRAAPRSLMPSWHARRTFRYNSTVMTPPPSLQSERAKLADFYAARSRTIPPLPWQTFPPPFSDIEASTELRDPAETRFRLFGSLARFLRSLADSQALVLVLDDLHWADVPSLRLLEFLAEDMATSRIMILGTYREMELSRRHRLSDTLGAMAHVPHFQRLHLSGLTAEDVHHFVGVSIEKPPPAWLTRAIHEQTEGNPLFVREGKITYASRANAIKGACRRSRASMTGPLLVIWSVARIVLPVLFTSDDLEASHS